METTLPQRALWLGLGFLSTACGIAGIVLPLVPTTPFLLLAAFSFARSSPRLHDWLITHPRLGPPILRWRTHRAISARAKASAVLAMAAALGVSAWMGVSTSVVIVQAAVMVCVAAVILSRPSGPTA